jgi:diguanylate cyclase (GGDEF)-like protein
MGPTHTDTEFSWICRDQRERTRFLDLHEALLDVNGRILLVIVVCMAIGLPALGGPKPLLPAFVGILLFGAIQRGYRRFRRPELWVFFGLLEGETAIMLALHGAHLTSTPALALMAWPVAGLAGRFRGPAVIIGTAFAIALVAAVEWLDRAENVDNPAAFLLPLAALFAVASVAAVHRDSDIRQRGSATIDPLTGLLNRAALNTRVDEVAEHSRVMRAPVAVIVADLDHFKAVNDTHGHTTGDHVLTEVAYRLRTTLRAYDLVYRIGGEEFVVVVLGQNTQGALQIAEALRRAITAEPIAGLTITASFGVAGSAAGEPFVWDEVFAAADAALYDAKAAGRDCVRADPAADRALSFAATPT